MRFLRVILGPTLVSLGDGIERVTVLNNQYLTDGTVIELSRIDADRGVDDLFEANPATIDHHIIEVDADQQYVYHHLRPDESDIPHQLISLIDEYRLLLVYPISFDREIGATVTLMGTTEKLQQAFDRLPPEIRREITIDKVTGTMPALGGHRRLLTRRQREVLDTAVDVGYYAVPRTATAADIAEIVGCAPSTASEHLRKIEARVFSSLAR